MSASTPAGLSHHDPLVDDANLRHTRLASDGQRLFSSSNDLSIDVLDVLKGETKVKKDTYTNSNAFEECLHQQTNGNRFYVLKPSKPHVVSRCTLHISEGLARKMIDTHKVMPSFLDHLHAYGRREKREQDASFGGGRYKLGFSASKIAEYELCYTLKFGVNNGRKEPLDPYAWSIRQTSVYQKFRYSERNSTWILVQPAESVQSRLMAAVSNQQEDDVMESPIQNPLKMHLLFLSAVSEGWRDYYNHLEKIFYHTTKAAVNFSVQRSNEKYNAQGRYEGIRDPSEQFEVDFEDVQDLQRFEELLRRVKTALEINEDSIRSLRALNDKLRDLAGEESSLASWSEVDIEAEQQLAIVARHKRNFDTLLKNVHGRAQLLFNVLDFRNALTVSFTGQRAVDISYLQTNERTMMTMIQEMSTRDAIGVKVLTLLATLYVPASFVAILIRLLWLRAL
ncbi:hypothetical protein K440DRAFT_608859 [Wilcoxina mikolae CBS 423.85]|nr:hypothetical protein K440DRAFT_608859 [Wilcoxina mikolae CBS 423.85]